MRDPDRIYEFCNTLASVWSKYPDMRFGQLIVNVLGVDPFYIEDDKSLELIEKFEKNK